MSRSSRARRTALRRAAPLLHETVYRDRHQITSSDREVRARFLVVETWAFSAASQRSSTVIASRLARNGSPALRTLGSMTFSSSFECDADVVGVCGAEADRRCARSRRPRFAAARAQVRIRRAGRARPSGSWRGRDPAAASPDAAAAAYGAQPAPWPRPAKGGSASAISTTAAMASTLRRDSRFIVRSPSMSARWTQIHLGPDAQRERARAQQSDTFHTS